MFSGYGGSGGGGPGGGRPKGYIAGRGRGAAGFQTRSDLGNSGDTHGPENTNNTHTDGGSNMHMKTNNNSPWGSAPQGYVAGAGRGASKMGATTGIQQQQQQSQPGGEEDNNKKQQQQNRYQNQNRSSLNAPGAGTGTGGEIVDGQYDDDDNEADFIWAAVDERLQNRNNKKRKKNAPEGPEHDDDPRVRERLKIQHQFRDCKQKLASLNEQDWMNIPDAMGDHSLKFKRKQERKKNDVFTPISDSMLESRSMGATNEKDNMALNTAIRDGTGTSTTTMTGAAAVNMSGIGAARGTVLGMSLDKMSDNVQKNEVSGGLKTSIVDRSGYLTSMNTLNDGTGTTLPTNLGDIHKARLLLKSVRDTNPKHGPGWIASARVEEAAGKTLKARKVIQQGCEVCGAQFVDVWLEAARLHPIKIAKAILATGVRRLHNTNATSTATNNKTIPLFLKAAELENTVDAKKAVLRKALEANPNSLELWKYAIGLEESTDRACLLLEVAVEKVPSALELWLALARLQSYEKAQATLNRARKALPSEKSIWIAASKLEESQRHNKRIPKIIDKAFKSLGKQDGVEISRKQWIEEAQECENSGAPQTSQAIIQRSIGLGVLDEDRLRTWSSDAKHVLEHGRSIVTARSILSYALEQFPMKRSLWMQAIDLEKKYGGSKNNSNADNNDPTKSNIGGDDDNDGSGNSVTDMDTTIGNDEKKDDDHKDTTNATTKPAAATSKYELNIALDEVLQDASDRLPKVEVFWLLRAKEQWLSGDVDKAREILQKAFEVNPSSERVWLAAAKLEWSNDEIERSRLLLERARDRAPTYRVYMKSAMLEREQGQYEDAIQLIEDGIAKYPTTASKLYMMGGQIYSEDLPKSLFNGDGGGNATNTAVTDGDEELLKKKKSYLEKARKIYQNGIEKCTSDPSGNVELWILASRLEERTHTFLSLTEGDNSEWSTSSSAGITKARSLLELARLKHPKNDRLWLEAVQLEQRSNSPNKISASESLMARALQDCPKSGLLLAESIRIAPRVVQKSKSQIAIKRDAESPYIINAVATLFASDRKITKARRWYERSVLLDKNLGDSWAYYYVFECEHGTKQHQIDVKERCIKAEPKHGELWQSVAKNITNIKEKKINKESPTGDTLELVAIGIKDRDEKDKESRHR